MNRTGASSLVVQGSCLFLLLLLAGCSSLKVAHSFLPSEVQKVRLWAVIVAPDPATGESEAPELSREFRSVWEEQGTAAQFAREVGDLLDQQGFIIVDTALAEGVVVLDLEGSKKIFRAWGVRPAEGFTKEEAGIGANEMSYEDGEDIISRDHTRRADYTEAPEKFRKDDLKRVDLDLRTRQGKLLGYARVTDDKLDAAKLAKVITRLIEKGKY